MNKISRVILLIAVWSLCGHPGFAAAQPQNPQGTDAKFVDVKVANSNMWTPVWITKVAIGSQFLVAPYSPYVEPLPGQVLPGQNFTAGSDWLKNMTIFVMNRTNKPVASLTVSLRFPQTQPTSVYFLQLGRLPDVDAIDKNGKPFPDAVKGTTPLALQPGQTLAIHVSDSIDKIKANVERAVPLSAINETYIYVDSCEFDDGMRYAGGAFSVPDANQPGQWVYRPRGFFPGEIHQYLPNVVKRAGEPLQQ